MQEKQYTTMLKVQLTLDSIPPVPTLELESPNRTSFLSLGLKILNILELSSDGGPV